MENQIAAVKRITVKLAVRYLNNILAAVVCNKVVTAAVLINLRVTVACQSGIARVGINRDVIAFDSILSAVDFDKNIFAA